MREKRIELIHGDCFEVLPELSEQSVDMILTDLPYGTTNCRWDTEIDLEQLWLEFNRVVKRNGAVVLFAQPPFDKYLAMSNIKDFRYEWIWHKTQPTGYLNANRMPMKAHENILVFYKRLPTYNPQKTTGHQRKQVGRTARQKSQLKELEKDGIYNAVDISKTQTYDSTERFPIDIIEFPKDTQKTALHPTQKPVALLEYLIKTYTNEGETVLDATMGSGSTGVACINTNRQFIGIEKDSHYFNVSRERIDAVQENVKGG